MSENKVDAGDAGTMSTAPLCVGCQRQMSAEQEPWRIVTWELADGRPRSALFCPECGWRVETFAENVDGEAVQLEDNTPASVFRVLGAGVSGEEADDAPA
jgi:hypothetical protein